LVFSMQTVSTHVWWLPAVSLALTFRIAGPVQSTHHNHYIPKVPDSYRPKNIQFPKGKSGFSVLFHVQNSSGNHTALPGLATGV